MKTLLEIITTKQRRETILLDKQIKHLTQCRDCVKEFFLEDVDWCIHHFTEGVGTKECPQCHNCICHGQTSDAIQNRFDSNIQNGKFVPCGTNSFGWQYMCKTVKAVEV